MADKFLTEAEWKKFAKGRDLKDAALIKALAAFEKAEKAKKPDEQIEALAAIEKEVDTLRKFVKGDREFGAQLDGMERALAREEKLAKSAPKEPAGDDNEEDNSPALLTTQLIPLLREIRKGETTLPALIVLGTKEAAVLISRRAIAPTRKKLLVDFLGESGSPKSIAAQCLFEENAVTFVVQAPAAGLAKKLRAALLKQTELRLKVRVRGEDGAVDDDGEAAEQESAESHEEEASPQPGTDKIAHDFNNRLAGLMIHAKPLLAGGGATGPMLKQKLLEAGNAAREHAFTQANQLLDEAQALIFERPGTTPSAPLSWPQAHRLWLSAMEAVDGQLNTLRAAILEWLDSDEEEVALYGDAMREIAETGLNAITANHRVKLMASLAELGSGEPAMLKARGAKALGLIREFESFLASSERVAACDENELDAPVAIRSTLTPPLRLMAGTIETALAA